MGQKFGSKVPCQSSKKNMWTYNKFKRWDKERVHLKSERLLILTRSEEN